MNQRKFRLITRRTTTLYVNSVTGSDANDGRSPDKAKLTLTAAIADLPNTNGTIRVSAPSTNPLQGFIQISSGKLTLEGYNGADWYVERTQTFTTGWSSVGGGVYSRTASGANYLYVPTLLDGNGFARILAVNTGTPTTPAAGEFGTSGGTLYVHLPGDADPNSHTIKRPQVSYLLRSAGTCQLTLKNCVGRYNDSGGIFENTSTTAALILENCTGQYSGNGVVGGGGSVYATHCTMQRCLNDGFNHSVGLMMLTNCDASYNDDEGASNHTGSTMVISGGRFHHNFSGGCTAVNSGSKMHLTNVLVDFNGAKNGAGIEKNGIVFDTGTSGSVTNCTAQNNVGSGYYCNSASVTLTNLTSGTEQGNTLADIIC